MKKILFAFVLLALFSCNNEKEKAATPETPATASVDNPPGLPYTPSYSTNWAHDVSDADLKTVLQSYKDWSEGNMKGLGAAMADTVDFDMSSGTSMHLTRDSLIKMWTTSRDSLKSVVIDMATWHKMYSVDKKDEIVVTWYKEIDTYKTGKVDSAYYHDINMLKNGKIVWYSQYKRPILPKK